MSCRLGQSLRRVCCSDPSCAVLDREPPESHIIAGVAIPDATTLWLFREKLARAGLIEQLFDRFDQHLAAKGYMARGGQIIDASIVLVPTQRNSRDENAELQAGRTPAGWKHKPAKVRQKDRDARWTKKHGRSFFGYKNHVNADAKHKLIRHYAVADAAVHDSQELDGLLDKGNTCNDVFADSAYRIVLAVASTIFGFPIIMVLNGLSVGSIEFCVQSDAASEGPPSYFSKRGLAPLTRRLCRCLGTKSPARRDGAWRFETLNRTSPAVSRLNYSNRRLENKCCLIKAHAITRDRTI